MTQNITIHFKLMARSLAKTPALKPPKKILMRRATAVAGGVLTGALSLFLLLWRLASLTKGRVNVSELAAKHALLHHSPWWKSPSFIYGPYYLLLHATYAINRSVSSFRLASVVIGLITAALIYWLINQWHGYKLAVLATVTFVSGLGVLAVARQGSPLSSQLLLSISLLTSVVAINRWHNYWGLLAVTLITAGDLYIPGALWPVMAMLFLSFTGLKKTLRTISLWSKSSLYGLGLLLLAPLIYRLGWHYSKHQLIYWLGYGLDGKLNAVRHFALHLAQVPLDLFFHSTNLPATLSLGHLPLLPVAQSVIIVLGFYGYISRFSNYRWRSILILGAVLWIVIGFGVLSVYSLLPLTTLAIGTGMAFMLKEWYSVFPRNPIARNLGLMVLSSVMLFSCFYSARSYFVGWANDPSTLSQYSFDLK